MLLRIDGHCVEPQPEQSLLQIVRQLGLDCTGLSDRPLAAKIAGEVFTLNYIPVRQKDVDQDRPSMRRAMAASGAKAQVSSAVWMPWRLSSESSPTAKSHCISGSPPESVTPPPDSS